MKTKLLIIFYSIFQYAINYRTIHFINFFYTFNLNLVMCKEQIFDYYIIFLLAVYDSTMVTNANDTSIGISITEFVEKNI